jgi:membrane protease YdiL (CAAX protease family)
VGTDGTVPAAPSSGHARRRALLALALLVPVPSLAVFVAVPDASGRTPLGADLFYVFSKVWLVALPLVWRHVVDRRPPSLSPTTRRHLALGAGLGLLMCAVIVLARLALGVAWLDGDDLRTNLAASGIDTPAKFLALAAGITIVNAFAEEVVWRWFVVEKSAECLPARLAGWSVPLAAVLFTLHHVVALDAHFGPLVTVLGSLGVFAGGWIWSALYRRTGSIWPCYLSHVLVDAALMAIGYHLLFM